jgi:predicted esterase
MAASTDRQPWLDRYEPASTPPSAVVLLLHGSGPNERDVMAPLATELSRLGTTVLVPDWDQASTALAGRLMGAAAETAHVAARIGCRRVLVAGWSAGGSAALWLSARDGSPFTEVALIGTSLEPLPGLPPIAPRPVPAVVVVGSADVVVTATESSRGMTGLRQLGHTVRTVTVDADHAGLIGTEYDDSARRCRPGSRVDVVEAGCATARAILDV